MDELRLLAEGHGARRIDVCEGVTVWMRSLFIAGNWKK